MGSVPGRQDRKHMFRTLVLGGPDGSRHSSDQDPKDVTSEYLNYCPIFVLDFCPPEGKLPRCGISEFLQCLNFLSHLPRNSPRASRGRKVDFLSFLFFCALKLLRA